MNKEEKIAENYLMTSGYQNIIFEPDGNVPPDFSIDRTIAIEVRRLNQHYFNKDKVNGLENDRIPLFKLLEASLNKFDSQYKGNSYWISIRFSRPIPNGKTAQKAIINSLKHFLNNPCPLPIWIHVTETISLHISESYPVENKVFRFALGVDRESGGFVLSEFKKNFNYCMKEKSEKIKPYYNNYDSWWLILIDNIAYGFSATDKTEIKSMIIVNSLWEKIIVLNSQNGHNLLEI